jgi:DNA polymerase-3 subunit delta
MKIKPAQLTEQLKRGLAPVYWLSGDEPLLLQECADAIRKTAQQQGFTERDIFDAGKDFDWIELTHSAQSLSLFAERKILDVRLSAGKLTAEASETLSTFCALAPTDLLLLISSPKIDKNSQKSNWYKTLDKHGTHVEIWPINAQELPGWIMAKCKQHRLQIHPDTGRLLASRVEGNLLAAMQEIEKLKLLANDQPITPEMIDAVSDNTRYDVFVFVDSVLSGDVKRIIKILSSLRAEGIEPAVVLWALSRELRQLITISRAAGAGEYIDAICQKMYIFSKQIPLIKQALKRNSTAQLEAILQMGSQVDKSIKGLAALNPWDGLSAMSLRLAGLKML